jgi:hypothetical protein
MNMPSDAKSSRSPIVLLFSALVVTLSLAGVVFAPAAQAAHSTGPAAQDASLTYTLTGLDWLTEPGYQVTNISPTVANTVHVFYSATGDAVYTTVQVIPAGGRVSIYLPNLVGLPPNFSGSVTISSTQPLDVKPSPARTAYNLRGQVTAPGGVELPGQTVTLWPAGPSLKPATTVTGADGGFATRVLAGRYTLSVTFSGGSSPTLPVPQYYYLNSYDTLDVQADTTLDIELPLKQVSVTVTNDDGQPVQDAVVQANLMGDNEALTLAGLPAHGGSDYYWNEQYTCDPQTGTCNQARTDANGKVTLWLFPTPQSGDPCANPMGCSGQPYYVITARPPAGSLYQITGLYNAAIAADTALNLVMPLVKEVTISGRITGPDGQGVVGDTVVLFNSLLMASQQAITGDDGSYTIQAPNLHYDLQVNHYASYDPVRGLPVSYSITLLGGMDLLADRVLDIALPLTRVQVQAVDSAGTPVQGAFIRVDGANGSADLTIDGLHYSGYAYYQDPLGTCNSWQSDCPPGVLPTTTADGTVAVWLFPSSPGICGPQPCQMTYSFTGVPPLGSPLQPVVAPAVEVALGMVVRLTFPGTLPSTPPHVIAVTPTTLTASGQPATLTVTGTGFVASSQVLWNSSPRPTTFISASELSAQIDAADTTSALDISTAMVNVQSGAAVSNAVPVTLIGSRVAGAQTEVAAPGETVTVQAAGPAGGAAVSASLANEGSGTAAAVVTAAAYNENPAPAPVIDVGGGFVDLRVIGADPADSMTSKFYYPASVTGTAEGALQLWYYDEAARAWTLVRGSDQAAPIKDMDDNLDGTVSGGRYTVVFDSTSTPAITALSGTVLALTLTDNIPPAIQIAAPAADSAVLPAGTALHFAATDDRSGVASVAAVLSDGTTSRSVADSDLVGPGVYTLIVTAVDRAGNHAEASRFLVVYDPSGGFVTGGGWINLPAGAYTADATLSGKAIFGFEAKYQKGATVPSGQTEFQFKVGGLNFHSTSYQWLVVSGSKAQYKGKGTINGSGSYGFLLSAIDGGASGPDKFRIKIWDPVSGHVVYDNQTGTEESADPTTVIAGGSITVHR